MILYKLSFSSIQVLWSRLYSIAVVMNYHPNRGALLTAVKDSISVLQSRELQFTDLEISKNLFDLKELFIEKESKNVTFNIIAYSKWYTNLYIVNI